MNPNEKPGPEKAKNEMARGFITGMAGVLGIICLITSFAWMLDTDSPSFTAKLTAAGIFFVLGLFFIWLRFKRPGDDVKQD
jgi:hypothetical protein